MFKSLSKRILIGCICCSLFMPVTVIAKDTNENAPKAYASTIEKVHKANNTEYSSIYFRLADMDKDGTDELLFTTVSSFNSSYPNTYTMPSGCTTDLGIYTYKNGTVKKLIENYPGGGNASEFIYSIKKNRIYSYEEGSGAFYYKVANGKLKSLSLEGINFDDIPYDKNIKFYRATLSNIRKYVYKDYKVSSADKKKVVKITSSRKVHANGYKEKITLYGKAKDGSTVWKYSSPYTWLTELNTNEYFVNENMVYLFSDKIYALDKSTGKKKWSRNQPLGGVSTAFDSDGNMYYTGYYADKLYCISPNGTLKFEAAIPEPYYWPYKISLSSKKVRVYVDGGVSNSIDSNYLTYSTTGKYLGLNK